MIRNGLRVRAKSDASSAADTTPIDADLVRTLAQLVSESDLAEIEIEKGDLRIRLTRHHRPKAAQGTSTFAPAPVAVALPVAAPSSAPPPAAIAPDADHPGMVKSPMVGTVYRRANPEAKSFVEIGSVVKAGDRVLLVEAMKTFNDIVATRSGTVTAILVEDNQPVEYNEPLLLIE